MKTKLIIVVLLASTSLGRATQIDLTPGGFSPLNPPSIFVGWEQTYHQIIAHADISGNIVTWHPSFPLGTDNFVVHPQGANANISWDLANIEGGSFLYLVTGGLKNGSAWVNLYQVSLDQINGSGLVTIDGSTTISAMNFFGHVPVPVPETVNTSALLFFAVLGLFEAQRRSNARSRAHMPQVKR
jgi:hypothetical protein